MTNSLYSDDFADTESTQEEVDSPMDGYFSHRSHPQDLYSQLPTSSHIDRKTDEDQEEQDLSPISTPPRT
ncbi:hypothetical protein LTS18_002102, partial [Coniosporium uncinatum]